MFAMKEQINLCITSLKQINENSLTPPDFDVVLDTVPELGLDFHVNTPGSNSAALEVQISVCSIAPQINYSDA